MQTDKIDPSLPYERRYWPGAIIHSGRYNDNTIYKVVNYRQPCKNDLIIDANVVKNFECSFAHPPLWIVQKVPLWSYDTAYVIGQVVTNHGTQDKYRVIDYRVPEDDEYFITNYSHELATHVVNDAIVYPSSRRWIVTPVPPEFEIRTVHYLYDEEKCAYEYFEDGFQVRVYNDRKDGDELCVSNDHVAVLGLRPQDWKRCEFVEDPRDTHPYKYRKFYKEYYGIGDVIKIDGTEYKITAYEQPKGRLWLFTTLDESKTAVTHAPIWDIDGGQRFILEPIWKYETAYKQGQIITATDNKQYEVVSYGSPQANDLYIFYATRRGVPFITTNPSHSQIRWIVKPVLTREESFKQYLRALSKEAFLDKLLVRHTLTDRDHYNWIRDVAEERLK